MENDSKDYINGLPIELIEYIFSYLTIDDIKEASLVCKQWFISSQCPQIVSKTRLLVDNKFSIKEDTTFEFLNNGTTRRFTSAAFQYVMFDEVNFDNDEIWKKLGKTVTELSFNRCTFSQPILFKLLDYFPDLTELSIIFPVHPIVDCDNILAKYADKLKTLSLINTFLLNEESLKRMSEKKPTIENLTLFIFNYVEKFSVIIKILEKLSVNLKSLSIYLWDVKLQLSLSQMNQLHLETLVFDINEEMKPKVFRNFAQSMTSLVHLDISHKILEDANFIDVCTYMINLKSLQLKNCKTVTNEGFIHITRLKKLEKFVVSKCANYSNGGVLNGLAKVKNLKMKCLAIEGYFSDDALIAIAENLPNLCELEITTSMHISDKSIRIIFKHLKMLRILSLELSDYQKFIPSTLPESYNISTIKGLRKITFNGFGNIPGASLEEISELVELEVLKVCNFKSLPEKAIQNMVKNCRCLKIVDFSSCESISNEMVLLIGVNLRRLKRLNIVQTEKITEETVKIIKGKNKKIYMDVYEMKH